MGFLKRNRFTELKKDGSVAVWHYASRFTSGTDSDRDAYYKEARHIRDSLHRVRSYWSDAYYVEEYIADDGTVAKLVTNMDYGTPHCISYSEPGEDDGWAS